MKRKSMFTFQNKLPKSLNKIKNWNHSNQNLNIRKKHFRTTKQLNSTLPKLKNTNRIRNWEKK